LSLKKVIEAKPDVIAHNVEVVERLTKIVRDKRAGYEKSLEVLRKIKEIDQKMITKSSIMVGLGEEKEEIIKTMEDIKNAGCEIITIGQYLQPTRKNLPVVKYYKPEEFKEFEKIGYDMGFNFVASGIFVRSSYRAKEAYLKI
ncbi:MAG: radical SAM protein, partial [candidate division WOR-3 bacterium]